MNLSGTIILKAGKEQSALRKHPWVFSGAIQAKEGDLTDGCWAQVQDHKRKTLGFGHFQNGSIAVRMLSFRDEKPGENFWSQKISDALLLRKKAGLPSESTNSFRLVHGEGDSLSGLIIDYYDGSAVMQAHSAGMHIDRMAVALALKEVLGDNLKSIYYKSKSTLPGQLKSAGADGYLLGKGNGPYIILENGVKFFVDWEEGQKTGFFLDQRDNRKLLMNFSNDKAVLNTFCYTGGFSAYALKGGARQVHSIDASDKAIEMARKNIELNDFNSRDHECLAADTFDFLKDKENAYDVIILDPPAFAKHREARHQAVKGYQRLNSAAMRVIRPGGIIFTFSCSQVVDRQLFYDTIVSSAIQAKRVIKVLHHLSQPADHPVLISHPEGEYLKGLVLYVS